MDTKPQVHSKPPEMSLSKNLFVVAIITSLVIGGLSGGIFGVVATQNPQFTSWIQKNVLNSSRASSTANLTGTGSTLQVQEDSATVDVVKQATPAVVSIVVKQDLSKLNNNNTFPFFNSPFQFNVPQGEQQIGAGTGFIITSDGLILTNKHVVSAGQDTTGSATQYTVIMNDGKQYDATVVDTDPVNDFALIRIKATGLPKLDLGDSDTVRVGQTVIAIGNALGQFSNTVTKGVISGLSRTITAGDSQNTSERLENIFQTDAAINFGNSGGPLLNLAGQVVGLNTAISQQGQLIGFAIPINQAKTVIASVQKYGKIVRPYMGVRYVQVDDAVAAENKLSVNYGALLLKGSSANEPAVIAGSPADKAGLVENDIILEFNGKKITADNSLASAIQKLNPGDTVQLKVLRQGKEKNISVTLEEFK